MKIIIISDHTYRTLRGMAIGEYIRTDEYQLDDGNWVFPLLDEQYEQLQQLRKPGESDDDALLRLLYAYQRRPSH